LAALTQSAVAVGKVTSAVEAAVPPLAAAIEEAGMFTRAYEPPLGSVTLPPVTVGVVEDSPT
jgi:hypothetical protein